LANAVERTEGSGGGRRIKCNLVRQNPVEESKE
jgi:hypothetical protein